MNDPDEGRMPNATSGHVSRMRPSRRDVIAIRRRSALGLLVAVAGFALIVLPSLYPLQGAVRGALMSICVLLGFILNISALLHAKRQGWPAGWHRSGSWSALGLLGRRHHLRPRWLPLKSRRNQRVQAGVRRPNKRVNLTRPTVSVVTWDRSPRRLRAVRWTHEGREGSGARQSAESA